MDEDYLARVQRVSWFCTWNDGPLGECKSCTRHDLVDFDGFVVIVEKKFMTENTLCMRVLACGRVSRTCTGVNSRAPFGSGKLT